MNHNAYLETILFRKDWRLPSRKIGKISMLLKCGRMSIVSAHRVSSVTTKFGHVTLRAIRLVPYDGLLFIFLRPRVPICIATGSGNQLAVISGSFMYTSTCTSWSFFKHPYCHHNELNLYCSLTNSCASRLFEFVEMKNKIDQYIYFDVIQMQNTNPISS